MKNEDEPVRWMACVYAKEIIDQAARFLVEEAHPSSDRDRAEMFANQIEVSLKKLRFNLQKPK